MLARRLRRSSGESWDGYLYKEGDEYTDQTGGWVVGYTDVQSGYEGSQSKESDHLYLEVSRSSGLNGYRTYVTNIAIDLTGYSSLKIDWLNNGTTSSYSGNERGYIVASTNKTSDPDTYNARKYESGIFSRKTTVVDVSGLSGSYYIRVHARGYYYSTVPKWYYAKISAYNIWLE